MTHINEAKKNDYLDKKLRWDLLPLEEVEEIVEVYTKGAEKYGENTWQNLEGGMQRYKGALLRHLVLFEKGEEKDTETGCKHLAQVAWNAIAMLYLSKRKKNILTELDKRIEEKIDNCNKLLDEIGVQAKEEIDELDLSNIEAFSTIIKTVLSKEDIKRREEIMSTRLFELNDLLKSLNTKIDTFNSKHTNIKITAKFGEPCIDNRELYSTNESDLVLYVNDQSREDIVDKIFTIMFLDEKIDEKGILGLGSLIEYTNDKEEAN